MVPLVHENHAAEEMSAAVTGSLCPAKTRESLAKGGAPNPEVEEEGLLQ